MTTEEKIQDIRRRLQIMRRARDMRDVHPFDLTDEQRHEQAIFLARMRANKLRHPPSIFGALE